MQNKGKVMVYEGETACSARIRGAEHMRDLRNKNLNGALFKHKHICAIKIFAILCLSK